MFLGSSVVVTYLIVFVLLTVGLREAGEGRPGEISRQPKSISFGAGRGAGNHSESVGVAARQRRAEPWSGVAQQLSHCPGPRNPQLHHQGHPCVEHPVMESNCLSSNIGFTISSLCDCGQVTSPL